MAIRLKSFIIFGEKDFRTRDIKFVVGQEDKEFHDPYGIFFFKG